LIDGEENLANYKVPRELTILDELPHNSTGKVDRRELRVLVDGG
jgi:acyl-CoA synthetase (AMP-forming)/AMP-acid ligase II